MDKMTLFYPQVILCWNSGSIMRGSSFTCFKDIVKKKFCYQLEVGQRLRKIAWSGNPTPIYYAEVLEIREDGLLVNDGITKEQVFAPFVNKTHHGVGEMYIEPCERFYNVREDTALERLLKERIMLGLRGYDTNLQYFEQPGQKKLFSKEAMGDE